MLQCFGLTINSKKSNLVPTARFNHLGLRVDLRRRQFVAPAEKVRKVKAAALKLAQSASQHRRYCNKNQLASFVGMAIALSPAIPAARF